MVNMPLKSCEIGTGFSNELKELRCIYKNKQRAIFGEPKPQKSIEEVKKPRIKIRLIDA
jgi:hypothetical protein